MAVDLTIGGRWRLVSPSSGWGYDLHHLDQVTRGPKEGKWRWKLVGRNLGLQAALERVIQEAPHDYDVTDLASLAHSLAVVKAEIATYLTFPKHPEA